MTTSFFVDGLHDLHPLFDLLGLALAEHDHAALVLAAERCLRRLRRARGSISPICGLVVVFFPFVAGNDAFALVADVDEDELVVDAEDFAFDDLIGADVAALEPAHVVGQGIADGDVPVFVRNVELTN